MFPKTDTKTIMITTINNNYSKYGHVSIQYVSLNITENVMGEKNKALL